MLNLPTTKFSVDSDKGQSAFISFLGKIGAFISKSGKSFVIMPENLAKHNLDTANLSPLLPDEFTCFYMKIDDKQVLIDKMQAQMAGEDYVQPAQPLLVSLAKDKTEELAKGLSTMLNAK